MLRSRLARLRPRRPRHARLELEALEARWVPSAVRFLSGFGADALFPAEASRPAAIGFPVNFVGTTYTDLFVNQNGTVSFGTPLGQAAPSPLSGLGVDVLAPFFHSVDLGVPPRLSRVPFGTDTVDGRPAFGVLWYQADTSQGFAAPANVFQLVLIDRRDTGAGNFDVEFNYDRIQADAGASGGAARVGFAGGEGLGSKAYELPGSGVAGAFLDANPATGLVRRGRNSGVDGRYVYEFRAGQAPLPRAPVVAIEAPARPFVGAGTAFQATGRFADADGSGWTATVDYGDGRGPVPLALNPDRTFDLSHVYAAQANYTVTVAVTNADGARGAATLDVIVLPGGAAGLVSRYDVQVAAPGQTVTAAAADAAAGVGGAVRLSRAEDAEGDATVFFALYDAAPVATQRQGKFFDVQLKNPDPRDTLTLTFSTDLLKGDFEFGYFTPETGSWVSMLNAPDLADVTVDKATGTMTVHFKKMDFLNGTVFTVSLPPAAGGTTTTTTTAAVQPPTAAAAAPSSSSSLSAPRSGTVSDSSLNLAVATTFTSSTQLSVALTASRDSQVSANGNAQGSGGLRSSAAASSSVSGGPAYTADEEAFWQWLATDDGAALLRWLSTDDGPAQLWLLEAQGIIAWPSSAPGGARPAAGAREKAPARPAAEAPAPVAPDEGEGPTEDQAPPAEDADWSRRAGAALVVLAGAGSGHLSRRPRKKRRPGRARK